MKAPLPHGICVVASLPATGRRRLPLFEVGKRCFSSRDQSNDNDGISRVLPRLPFRFETGIATFAKRATRPFPPPFLSLPSTSFSEPLSTFDRSRDRRPKVHGELIRGQTNGDDAVYASDYFICANDGVGAWSSRPRGHAGLWSRLILHFWVSAMEQGMVTQRPPDERYRPDPISYLDGALERTVEATLGPTEYHGTTTVCGAQLDYRIADSQHGGFAPVLYVTNLGDCQVLVLRPRDKSVVYKTKEQWHWFDCPRQLGTNSPDTPQDNAVVDVVNIDVGDVVLAMSDGVIDNLWEHEIVTAVVDAMNKWEEADSTSREGGIMAYTANHLMNEAKAIALDPFAESPYMEHAIEEGLASEGGKLDDVSVVAAQCVRDEMYGK